MTVLIVPETGIIDYFSESGLTATTEDLLRTRGATRMVRTHLGVDGREVGAVVFDIDDTDPNPRATEITHLLCGSYVQVTGLAVFEIPDWGLEEAERLLRKVAAS